MNNSSMTVATLLFATLVSCQNVRAGDSDDSKTVAEKPSAQFSSTQAPATEQLQQATFGLGCFSCAEAIFEQLWGVESVDPGYSGGHVKKPTYQQVTAGTSGHAEVVQINYDPQIISYDELLEVFWKMHDPTILNRQFKDAGSHYRSLILYHNDEQRDLAKRYKEKLADAGAFSSPIITDIEPFKAFYQAEQEHLDFYRLNPENQYCTTVIRPKLDEFKKVFAEKMRGDAETGADQP